MAFFNLYSDFSTEVLILRFLRPLLPAYNAHLGVSSSSALGLPYSLLHPFLCFPNVINLDIIQKAVLLIYRPPAFSLLVSELEASRTGKRTPYYVEDCLV